MFEDNHMDNDDLRLKAILENGLEEVPDRVWDGVAKGLDRIAARKRFLWLGGCIAATATAAAVAIGVFFGHEEGMMTVPEAAEGMIAVVAETEGNRSDAPEELLLAEAHEAAAMPALTVAGKPDEAGMAPVRESSADEDAEPAGQIGMEQKDAPFGKGDTASGNTSSATDATEDMSAWEDDEETVKKKRIRASLTLSGIAGTNSPQAKSGSAPLRSPGIFKAPTKTTVEQVGKQVTYGIPVSFGAGVKIHFTKHWSLGMGLNYTMLTSRFNGRYTKVENGIQSVPISEYVRNTQHYIGIPINAYYNIISRDFINFYAYAGGTVEKCVGNHYRILTAPEISHKESVKGVQLSANAGIGVEFLLGRYVGIYLDPSLRYYFRSGQPQSIRTAQPLMLGFELGFRFNL